jgi:BirA family biotin operon repressor/biotin-[acetyl-CoA-carboxylase] ligase
MGIGVNVNVDVEEFPAELCEIATSVSRETGKVISRKKLLQTILSEFEALYDDVSKNGFESLFTQWRLMNCTIGYEVNVIAPQQQFSGVAVDIDEEGALLVRKDNGTIEKVIAGDVSIRRRC